jgi:hypothetical protein
MLGDGEYRRRLFTMSEQLLRGAPTEILLGERLGALLPDPAQRVRIVLFPMTQDDDARRLRGSGDRHRSCKECDGAGNVERNFQIPLPNNKYRFR